MTSATSSGVSQFASKKEMEATILEENKARCDFFKYFSYNENEKLGMVSGHLVAEKYNLDQNSLSDTVSYLIESIFLSKLSLFRDAPPSCSNASESMNSNPTKLKVSKETSHTINLCRS